MAALAGYLAGYSGLTRQAYEVELRQYIADIEASAREALASVNPVPYYMYYGENFWAGVKAHLSTVTERADPARYRQVQGVLAAADIEDLTLTTTFAIMQSLRLDKGPNGPIHPLVPRRIAPSGTGAAGPGPGRPVLVLVR